MQQITEKLACFLFCWKHEKSAILIVNEKCLIETTKNGGYTKAVHLRMFSRAFIFVIDTKLMIALRR